MEIPVRFGKRQLTLDVDPVALVGHWLGPAIPEESADRLTASAMADPGRLPPLDQAIYPGDTVALAVDGRLAEQAEVVRAIVEVVRQRQPSTIHCLLTEPGPGGVGAWQLGDDVELLVHDPDDRDGLAYLASTEFGRRVYLNRFATDADVAIPIGPIDYRGSDGLVGPWSVLFPGMSDRESQGARSDSSPVPDATRNASPTRGPRPDEEALVVSSLLGLLYQIGVVLGGDRKVAEVLIGSADELAPRAVEALDRHWHFRVEDQADLVVLGSGVTSAERQHEVLATCLESAGALVRLGGKVAVLADQLSELGPSWRRLIDLRSDRPTIRDLRGLEAEFDYRSARALIALLPRADVYLASQLDPADLQELGVIAIDRPEEVRRLVQLSPSTTVLSQAESTRVTVHDPSLSGD